MFEQPNVNGQAVSSCNNGVYFQKKKQQKKTTTKGEYDQKMPQLHTADQFRVPTERDVRTQTKSYITAIKVKSVSRNDCQTKMTQKSILQNQNQIQNPKHNGSNNKHCLGT